MKTVYGPVPSWRLGKSLGVDPISSQNKICSFNCIYCQLGTTKEKRIRRKQFVDEKRIGQDLFSVIQKKTPIDIVTLSGMGEPSLALNLDKIIKKIRNITDLPIAILTNSTLLGNKKIQKVLMKVDKVVAKLDAWDEKSFKKINNPHSAITFKKLLSGIMEFKKHFTKNFCLQIMFIKEIKSDVQKIAELARKIQPDEIQINTPLRPCQVTPLNQKQLNEIKKYFKNLNAYTVYEKEKPKVEILNLRATLKRRPKI
jgi:wyosine [tRNA(Phe)-imidazoG37] synthetase (radical SAM superfamily)